MGGTNQGGAAGSSAGTAGTSAGTAGTGPVDADAGDGGPEADSGVGDDGGSPPPPDGGVNGDCTFAIGTANLVEAQGQDFVISKVIFEGTTAHVSLRTTITASFADPQQLCSGPTDAECVPVDDGVGAVPAGTEFVVDITGIDPAAGELAYLSDLPSTGPFALAYVNWGGFASVDPPGPDGTLEALGVLGTGAVGFWTDGDSITLDANDNAFFANGDVTADGSFVGCTAVTF